jgi:hypothetical protein
MNPLDQLADIATPTGVSIWPLAWGYWLLILLVIGMLSWALVGFFQFRKKRQQKHHGMAALTSISLQSPYFAYKVQVVLKRLCAHYLPNAASQALYGNEWQSLLISIYKGSQSLQLEKAIDMLQQRLYANDTDENQPAETGNSENKESAVIGQNHLILVAIKDLVATSFPCKAHKHGPAATKDVSARSQEVSHV